VTTSPYGDEITGETPVIEEHREEDHFQEERPADRRPPKLRELDLRGTWQVVAGAILLPLGVAVIIIGWHGAAYGNVDQKQIPYLISGGILGLAIVVVGCFFFWAHWLYRIHEQAEIHHEEALREQREQMKLLIDALAAGGGRGPAGAVPPGVPVSANGRSAGRTFVATATGTNFHTAGCPMVANRGGTLRTISEQEAGEMKPCRVCEPLVSSN
jgi:hypothetical protein